jgi:putative SOS response-associated peptidase YedK
MRNDYGNHIPYSDYLAAFSQTRIRVKWSNATPNLDPRKDVWPTDKAPVVRRLEDGTNESAELRWGFPPARPKGSPVISLHSEGRRFSVDRCLAPASHFLRIHRREVAEDQVEIHESQRGVVLLRRALASAASGPRRLYIADGRSKRRCRAHP